jgi:hypothetical protein
MKQRSPENERATEKPVRIPTVLAVGCSDALLARCWGALGDLGVMVRDCDPALAPTLAATRRPLAIVVPNAVYLRDPAEFEALARDVRAALVKVHAEVTEIELEAMVGPALRSPERRREVRSPSGRYSILPGECFALEGGAVTRSEPPVSRPPVSGSRAVLSAIPDLDELEEELLSALR